MVDTPPPKLEIGALLAAAFDKQPSAELSERVVRRIALAATIGELSRLLTAAPVSWLSPPPPEDPEEPS